MGADQQRLAAIGARMVIDHWTGQVVTALRAAGVGPVLLKGPAIARWLYADRGDRSYVDADLLVRRSDLPASRAALAELGFALVGGAMGAPWPAAAHAETWFRATDHAAVDLHRCLHGLEHLPDREVFAALWREREPLALHGLEVPVPSERWRLLHVVLHLQPKDRPGSRAWTDVEQALDRLDPDLWRAAADLASELGVLDTMGPLLRLVPQAEALADSLDLPVEPPASLVHHHRRHAPALVRRVYRLRERGVRGVPRLVRMAVAPPPAAVRVSHPAARRGRAGLVAVYLWRIARLPAEVVRAVRHQRRQGVQRRLR